MDPIKKKVLIALASLSILFFFIMFGPPGVFKKTSTPDYCGSCHVMEEHHAHWRLTGLHSKIVCVDCHLPNNNPFNHFVWKGLDGLKDFLYFHLAIFSEPIEITGHGKKTVRKNCVRCHGEMVSRIDNERNCWDCHRRVNHRVIPVVTK